MSALEELMDRIESENKIAFYRKDLISARGTIFSGDLYEVMRAKSKKAPIVESAPLLLPEDDAFVDERPIDKIYLGRKDSGSSKLEPGFVFTGDGTRENISAIIHETPIELCRKYASFLFDSEQETKKWLDSSDLVKRRLVKENFTRMRKMTNDEYRSHGDRLLYYTLGKVILNTPKGRMVYPLFCFGCEEPNFNELAINVNTIGFINFVLDERLLDGRIKQIVGDEEICMDETIQEQLEKVKHLLEGQAFACADSLEVDINFSMISIITGFTPEYLDRAWRYLIK